MLPDIHEEKPEIPLHIDWVGIKGYMTNLHVCNNTCIDYLLSIDAKVDLPRDKRGVHMSRFIDAIQELETRSYTCIMDFLRDLAKKLLQLHGYARRARAKATTTILYRDVYIMASFAVDYGRTGILREYLKVSFYGNTLCPCLQQVYSYLEKTDPRHAPSHMQRTRLTITLTGRKIDLDPREIVDALQDSFSSMPRARLKRTDEYQLLKQALQNPRFVEDVVRTAAKLLHQAFHDQLGKDTMIAIKAVSEESIHPYNTVAIIQAKLSDLDKILPQI